VGNSLARFFGGLFILGATIGAGTIGVAVVSSAAATVITVNDASDPVSQVPCQQLRPELRERLHPAGGAGGSHGPESRRHHRPPGSHDGSEQRRALLHRQWVNGNAGELDITDTGGTVTILGAGASVVDIHAVNDTRVLEIGSGAMGGISANISGVTISNGNASRGRERLWRHLCQQQRQPLDAYDSVVSGNTAGTFGGGIGLYRGGSATLIGDTITGNTVATASNQDGGGGGIYVVNNDTSSAANLTIRDTTISGNEVDAGTGDGSGGGIDVFNTSGSGVDPNVTIDIDDSTISGNMIDGAIGATGAGSGIAASDGNWDGHQLNDQREHGGARGRKSTAAARSLPTPPEAHSSLRHGISTPSPATLSAAPVKAATSTCRAAALWSWVRASLPVVWRGADRRTAAAHWIPSATT
jgi:hypothetical protein